MASEPKKPMKKPTAPSEEGRPTEAAKAEFDEATPVPMKEPKQTVTPKNGGDAAADTVCEFYDKLVELPLEEKLPALLSHHLITRSTLERVGKPCYIRTEKNGFILQDVLATVQQEPDMLEVFCNVLRDVYIATELAQLIQDTFDVKSASPAPTAMLQSDMRRIHLKKWIYPTAILVGGFVLCVIGVIFYGAYLPGTAEMHRTGLPQEPECFVNRVQELETIMQSITGSKSRGSRIVTITGSPGYGKTTLAYMCGHRFISQRVAVRYVDLQNVCDIKGIAVKVLNAVGLTEGNPALEQLSKWAQRQNGALVLMLDNVDCFTLSGERIKKEFSHLIKDFIIKPSLSIHVVLTTQYQLGYIDSFKLIALDKLSDTHAKELLLCRSPSLTANVTATLANFTSGHPLALQILSALLDMPNAPHISVLLNQLDFDPVNTLSPENVPEKKLNDVFEVAIGYLTTADYQCFLVVCQFPGSFDDELASTILPHLVNESTLSCLRHLVDRSLLEYNRNTQRYIVIPLLKAFVNSTSHQYRLMVSQFYPVYMKHLLRTAMKKQLVSEVHLQNYLKVNYLGVQYLINGYVNWSYTASEDDANVDLILPFALSTFNIFPLLQPVDVVEEFWFSLQKVTWNITSEGFAGQCHEYLDQAIEFESLLADYVLYAGRNSSVEEARLSRHAQMVSLQFENLQFLVNSNCTETITLLRYLGLIAKHNHDEAVYHNVLQAIMKLASSNSISTTDAEYNLGVLYFDLNEYSLAVEFLNRSLTNNPEIQQMDAAKTMVLAIQRSGQQQLAVDTVKWLVPYLWQQAKLELHSVQQSLSGMKNYLINATNLDPTYYYEEYVQNISDTLSKLTDRYFAIVELPIIVNDTALSRSMLQNVHNTLIITVRDIKFVSSSPTFKFFSEFCRESNESSEYPLDLSHTIKKIMCFLEFSVSRARHVMVLMQSQLCTLRVVCDYLKAEMKVMLNAQHIYIGKDVQDESRFVTKVFSALLEREHDRKTIQVCSSWGTDSVECWMSRSHIQLLWQMQYELADGLAVFFGGFGMLEEAKEYTEIALEKLPLTSVKKKWKVLVDHKLNLARIERSLGNYWNAVYILRNCSLTIDKEQLLENVYQVAQDGTTCQSHDLSLPEGQFSLLVSRYVLNTSKVKAAVVSGTVRLLSHTGIVIIGSHLLFVSFLALLWLLVFVTLFTLGSTLYCVKFICSGCRHNCSDKIRLYLFNIFTAMFSFSHVVVFYAYVLHFHTTILLTYLNYL